MQVSLKNVLSQYPYRTQDPFVETDFFCFFADFRILATKLVEMRMTRMAFFLGKNGPKSPDYEGNNSEAVILRHLSRSFFSFFLLQTSLFASVPEEHAISISHTRDFCQDRFFWGLIFASWKGPKKRGEGANDSKDFSFEKMGPSCHIMSLLGFHPMYEES